MIYKILLINPNKSQLKEEMQELKKRGLNIVGVTNLEDACKNLREDGFIHVVLTEWKIPKTATKNGEFSQGREIYNAFLNLRHEVNIFLYTGEKNAVNFLSGGFLTGYFFKGEKDYDDIFRKIESDLRNSKNRAPFFETLVQYADKAKDSWHTPGHSSGYSVKNSPWVKDFYDFFGKNSFTSDVSVSVPMLDSLLHPTGVIKEAQELAARAFGSRYTFFSTNGTSTSNKVLLQTLLKPGDAIILDRNCHKSVHYGVIISGAEPIYLKPSINNKYGIFGPVPKKRIFDTMDKAIDAGKRVKVLILTNCTYDGLIYDISDIVKEAHSRGVKVIIDEAWFGYARFHPEFYPCAMEAGADYSTQSTHKTMSAFSQASMIHVNDPDFEDKKEFFMENFNMHTSTSPQYPMIASLDIARKQMVMEGYGLLSKCLELSDSFKKAVNSLKKFRVLEKDDLLSDELKDDNIKVDRTKLTIDISKSGLSSKEIEYTLLNKHNIQIEKSTFNTITVLITIGSTFSKLNRLYLALENIEKMSGNQSTATVVNILKYFKLTLSAMKYRPRHAFYCDGERVALRDAKNRISTSMVVPYPPGIPLLVPGQVVTEDIIETLTIYKDFGVEIHGLNGASLKVMTEEEEEMLTEKGYAMLDISEV